MPRAVLIETAVHGRVLVEDGSDPAAGLLVAFHGYAQNADDVLKEVRRIPGATGWRIAAVQALHRFYSRDNQRILASWMTREDREQAIADNIAYVDRAVDAVSDALSPLVFFGFSQGASMAYRAAVRGRHRARGVIALGGDIPPELKTGESREWPPVLVAAGQDDPYYTPAKLDADVAFLASRGIDHQAVRFAGGHEWTDDFRSAAGAWLRERLTA